MPRYFFHTREPSPMIDDEGIELADDAAARRAAIRFGGDLLSHEPSILGTEKGFRVEAVDAAGKLCCAVVILTVDGSYRVEDPE